MSATTRFSSLLSDVPALYLAIELSNRSWKLAFSTGLGQKPRLRSVPARDREALRREIEAARNRFKLPAEAAVRSCYEAGRDGFWLHRFLMSLSDHENLIVDSASIQVSRRKRRLKTDRIDVLKLVAMLIRYYQGEQSVWSVVRVPSVEAEDIRHLHRERITLREARKGVTNRIKGLLATQGVSVRGGRGFPRRLDEVRLWDDAPLGPHLRDRLEREWLHRCALSQRIKLIEDQQLELVENGTDPALECVRQLMRLRGIGLQSAWMFTFELFAWRNFKNRRELGALCGLTPSVYQSGDISVDLGISKAGNRLLRAMIIQIAWGWLYYQPTSELTRWFYENFSEGRGRKLVGIVALSRRLIIDLWRFTQTGALPNGAVTMT